MAFIIFICEPYAICRDPNNKLFSYYRFVAKSLNRSITESGNYALEIEFTYSTIYLKCVCSVLSMFSDVRNLRKIIYADSGKITLMAIFGSFYFRWSGSLVAARPSQEDRDDHN